jgi:acetyl-CoA acetyltransferase
MNPRAAVAVVGVGASPLSRSSSETPIAMAERAVSRALADAGLKRRQVDGLINQIGSPRGPDYDRAASLLGLEVRFAAQPWSHGRFAATVLQHAAMALTWGMADYVLCLAAYRSSSFGKHGSKERNTFAESLRDGGGPHAETPHTGLTAPVAGTAMTAQRYFHKYGVDRDKLAAIPIAFRKHARLNPGAVMQSPMDRDAYLKSRYIVEPLRLLDCSVIVDGAVAMILTTAERAPDTSSKPIWMLGAQGLHAGPNEFIFGLRGMGIDQASVFDEQPRWQEQLVYRMAGVSPDDIDTLHIYDAFSPQLLWVLERFGYCKPGEGADWVQGGRIELGGKLPCNTSGGHLSEGQLNGWGQMVEICTQLRGEGGQRQVQGAKLAQWATTIGDSIIFGNER